MPRILLAALLSSTLALFTGAAPAPAVSPPQTGSIAVLVAVMPADDDPEGWEISFRAHDLETGEVLARPRALLPSPATLHVGNPLTGENLEVEVRVRRKRERRR